MTDPFPGHRPLHGDAVRLTTDTSTYLITGEAVVQGVVRDGQGYLTLTLPSGTSDDQRRDLRASSGYRIELYSGGVPIYVAADLRPVKIDQDSGGPLVVTALPA